MEGTVATPRQEGHPAMTGAVPVALVAIGAGAVVALLLGLYGSIHTPTGQTITTLGFPSMTAMKVWLALVAGLLALVQVTTALRMYGKLSRGQPPASRAVSILHRASGTTAVVVSLPVAYSCLWSLGLQTYDTRVLVHSLAGCLFYGAFVTKMVGLHHRSAPGWLLPIAGGVVFSALIGVVLSSAVWYLVAYGPPS
ncbi:MAG: DUF6529 family protein [Nocardioidaceae bacterium]